MADAVRTEINGPILEIILNRPEKRNAVNMDILDGIAAAIPRALEPGVRVVILRGEGKAFSAGLDFNIFAGGVTGEKLRQKERELFLIERAREQLLDAVQLEVQEGFLSLQTARSRVSVTERAVEQAKENLRLQQLRYGEGVGTATEVLDAVSLATTAEQNFLNARYDVTEARARLGFAVGSDLVALWGGDTHFGQGGRP